MSDNLEQRIQEVTMSKTLVEHIEIALEADCPFTVAVLRDVLAEVAKGKCRIVEKHYFQQTMQGIPSERVIDSTPANCGTCIVCTARKVNQSTAQI